MIKVFNREGWSFCNKYFLDFCSLGPPQRLQPFMNCFSMVLSTGYAPSGIDFPVWVPHGPQVLLINQLLHGLLSSGSRFLQGMPNWSSTEFPMGCSRDFCSTLSSRWTKKTKTHRELVRFSWAQFSSLSMSTTLLSFIPSAHLLMMFSDHLPLPTWTCISFLLLSWGGDSCLVMPVSNQPYFVSYTPRIESS